MAYRVELTERAIADLEGIYRFIRVSDSEAAAVWFNGLERAIDSLGRAPERVGMALENPELRRLLYGKKPHVYRILFSIDEPAQRVVVLHIRHGARKSVALKRAALKRARKR